ncbi:ABC transporter permease [Tomitella gaofuii]|uniref:ABC transporter permease n=1 Tax=Tomitella gaofuii TaxID=2760083 RepID=UPI0015F92540|nr:ABC transporter permease [Tomitella gaofuii]
MTSTDHATRALHAADRGTAVMRRRSARHGATVRLSVSELRLMVRDPVTLIFVVAFPVVGMLIIGSSFGTEADEVFPVDPTQWYVASYFTTVIGAIGLVMLPVHIASYRERGVLRRFAVAGFPRWSFALAELIVGMCALVVGGVLVLAAAAPVFGVPAVADPIRVIAASVAGCIAFISIGVVLGTLVPRARSAQALGLMLFFPSFLLGAGGPPPRAMGDILADISQWMPLSLVTQAVRGPWLGLETSGTALALIVLMAVAASALAAWRAIL